jgi:hypothetical protein
MGGGRSQLLTREDESLLHDREFQPEQGGAGGQHKVEAGGHEVLVAAVDFAQAALGAVAMDRITDSGAGSDHADAGPRGRGPGGMDAPSQEEGPAVNAAALFTNGAEVIVAPQALPGAQAHLRQP